MQVDISFPFAKVYDISKVDVVQGQNFILLTDFAGPARWFTDNDPVLEISVKKSSAEVVTASAGESILLIMDGSFNVLKKIFIKVLPAPATDLGVAAEAPVQK